MHCFWCEQREIKESIQNGNCLCVSWFWTLLLGGKQKGSNYNCFLIRDFVLHELEKLAQVHLTYISKKPLTMLTTFELWPCGQPRRPICPCGSLGFHWARNGQTDWVCKGRGIKVISTKYTRQSLNVQNLGWCWLRIHVLAVSCWQSRGCLKGLWTPQNTSAAPQTSVTLVTIFFS